MASIALFFVGLGAGIGLLAIVLAVHGARHEDRPKARHRALRCSRCGIDWPPTPIEYDRCPVCLEPTSLIAGTGLRPLEPSEARSIRLHHEFERFYVAWRGEDAA